MDTPVLFTRCVAFLEQQLEEFERAEKDRAEERRMQTKKMLERMKQDDERLRSFEGQTLHSNSVTLTD